MTPFSFPLDRHAVVNFGNHGISTKPVVVHETPVGDTQAISVSAEAAARVLTQAAKRIRKGESVRDVCEGLVDVVIALSGRI